MTGSDSIHVKKQVNWLLDRGHEVFLMSEVNPFPEGYNARYQRVSLAYPKGSSIYSKVPIPALVERWKEASRSRQYRAIFRDIKPDVVHANWIDGGAKNPAYYLAVKNCRPLVLTVWGTDINQFFVPNKQSIDEARRKRAAETLRRADAVIVDAADMYEKCETLAQKPLRFELITLGVDTQHFRPLGSEISTKWRQKLGISKDAKVFVSIRAVGERYGHRYVLEAFAQAIASTRKEAVLVFIEYNKRSSDDNVAELRAYSERLGIADKVRWAEPFDQENVREIYAFADLTINYPLMDAFPVTFIEAAACCCRVVSCRLPAYEGTFAEEFFTMVEPANSDQLAPVLADELNRPQDADDSGLIAAQERMTREFDEAICAERLISLYREVAA